MAMIRAMNLIQAMTPAMRTVIMTAAAAVAVTATKRVEVTTTTTTIAMEIKADLTPPLIRTLTIPPKTVDPDLAQQTLRARIRPKKKKKTKKKSKSKNEKETEDTKQEEKEDDFEGSAIFRIQQISSKLSFLLDDLHRTFKPKAVPRIAPDSVFPQYPYRSLPTDSPKRLWRNRKEDTISLPPISINSPRCDGHCETGGEFVFPEYAAPPTEREIKELYGNRTDSERQNKSRRFRRDSAWEYETGNFSEEFITASNRRAEGDGSSDDAKRGDSDGDGDDTAPNDADPPIPSTFEALHERFEAERRCIEQRQNKIQRMRKKLWWFRKNNTGGPTVNVAEIEPLKGVLPQNTPSLSVRERERNLLNKAAEVLLGGGATARAKTRDAASDGEEASPDSLQIESLV